MILQQQAIQLNTVVLKNRAAVYCRLSRDDNFNGDNVSIQTQRQMLTQYAKDNGFVVVDTYVDDGYSGTNFGRPDFRRMESDIESGKVDIVLTKDLSRLGRGYLQTGYYTEIFFPQNDIRYIAINDGVDSAKGENEFAPFRNIMNNIFS